MKNVKLLPWFGGLIVCVVAWTVSAAEARADLIFESRAPGTAGGGVAIGNLAGHTFRLLERTAISDLGAYISGSAGQTAFGAVYKLGTPESTPDVVNDTYLLGTTLLASPGTTPAAVTGSLSLTLDPGWYSIVVGRDRHGATAGNFAITLNSTGTSITPQSVGPYSINPTTNARTNQSATTRVFVEGTTLPPVVPPPSRFLVETARPSAGRPLTPTSNTINNTFAAATRFEITDTTLVDEVGGWMRSGSGQIYAAIVQLSSPTANPLVPTHANFLDTVVGSTLIDVGSASEEYTGNFGGLELQPGSYALIFGSGLFGATGSAGIMQVSDQIVSSPLLWLGGGSWSTSSLASYRMFLRGTVVPEPASAMLFLGALAAMATMRRRFRVNEPERRFQNRG